ncbi:MAG: S9 family peptidase [Sporocytophaga sp.]|nr:S9 family peptidase [Sporocytophaga sp.]
MLKRFFVITLIFFTHSLTYSQLKKPIGIEDIWLKGTFRPETPQGFTWMKNDSYYTELVNDGTTQRVIQFDAKNGKEVKTIITSSELTIQPQINIEEYFFSPDESMLLLASAREPIYRRSSKSIFYLVNLSTKKATPLSSSEKISYPTFSPDGKKIAYVKNNDLYITSFSDVKETRITYTGMINKIINGSTDWVYEEEFEITKAFSWSEDSKKIAYLTFDESDVKEYNMQLWDGLYPTDYRFKYPKAGEKNSELSVSCYFTEENKIKEIFSGKGKDLYIPRLQWTKNPSVISFIRMNRLQNHMEILHADVTTGKINTGYEEKSDTYIEINDNLTYLADNKHFILTSEKSGFRHIYLYNLEGKEVRQITCGNWEVEKISGIEESIQKVYYTSTEASPLERQFYVIGFDGKNKKQISSGKGTHDIEMSSNKNFYLDIFSTISTPHVTSIFNKSGKEVRPVTENKELLKRMAAFSIIEPDFFQFKSANGDTFDGWMIKPKENATGKKLPVLFYVYGGPGYQTVKNEWMGPNYYWFQALAAKGYIIVSVDPRGCGGRGASIKKITQKSLGKYETEDLISSAKYISNLNYVDGNRIGIFGWSYGGYLSSLAMTLGADYFKTGIAVAPVTNWRFYDTIYTERYLGLPQENPEGYDNYSPLSHTAKLKGNYLLVHGTADDNVHVQNSMMMTDALVNSNKQFELLYYTNKNHGIYGGYTRFHLYKKMSDFIEKNL